MPRLEGDIDFFKSGTWLMQFLVLLLRNTVATRWIFVVNSLASCGSMVATHRGGLSAYPLRIRRILNDFVAIKNGTLGRFVSRPLSGKQAGKRLFSETPSPNVICFPSRRVFARWKD